MNDQMILVISSPSSSTTGLVTLIFAMFSVLVSLPRGRRCYRPAREPRFPALAAPRAFGRYGNRIDEVEFRPAWHKLMAMGVEHELPSLPWTSEEPARHAARAAMYMTAMQAEAGFCCPITMPFAVVPALRATPELAAEWEPRLMARTYEPRLLPPGQKRSAIAGMAMTEKQGGSEGRANPTHPGPP